MIRVDMQSISKSSRNTSGVYIVKGDDVISIARCPKIDKENDDEDEEDSQEAPVPPSIDEPGSDTLF
jgi:DNA gyrase subunit A